MLFSSVPFLYYFLPLTLAIYFLAPKPKGSMTWRNGVLLFFSLLFYFWGGPKFFGLLIAQTMSGWLFALLIHRLLSRGAVKAAKLALAASMAVGAAGLAYYKYADFFIQNVNTVFGISLPLLRLTLPIGISFYTFQVLSYVIDLYRGRTAVQRNPLTFLLYVSFFPALIAGPIVRYIDVEKMLPARDHSWERFSSGARRLVAGLGKKVLIANVLGELVSFLKDTGEGTFLSAWLYIITYAFHLYFDFSGYSDMALGMARMFGFDLLENFNYPYISKSITEFWRRWHISLSTWFRDYVYIPLGGNRVKSARHIFNILTVWLLTGFWHGAGWSFIAWGGYFGLLLLAEKFILAKVFVNMPVLLRHIYAMLAVLCGWVLFDSPGIGDALAQLGNMFGFGVNGLAGPDSLYYLRSYMIPLLIAAVGSTPLPKKTFIWLSEKQGGLMAIIEPLAVGAVLLIVTAFLVDGSFNPFIYFRF